VKDPGELETGQEVLQRAWVDVLHKTQGVERSERLVTPFGEYANDPVRFIREVLGEEMWEGQVAIANAVMKHKRVVVRGCRKVGKSFVTGALATAFVSTAPTVGLVTAPGERQIRDVIFAKIRQFFATSRAKLPGEVGVDSIRIGPEWKIIGIAAKEPEAVRGFHAGIKMKGASAEESEVSDLVGMIKKAGEKKTPTRLLIILEEAIGIDQPIVDALRGSMSGENVYVIMLANPLMSADSGHFYANAFKDGSGWYRIHIGLEEPKHDPTPSDECFHAVPDELRDQEWIDAFRAEYGEDSALFRSDVLGCFSDGANEAQIVPMHILEAAAKWEIVDDLRAHSRHIGCDIAGGETAGKDFCVATLWVNGVLSAIHRWKSPDTMHSLSILELLVERWAPGSERIPWSNVHIDATGIGKGVKDRLTEKGLFVDGVNFGAAARYDWRGLTGEMKFRDRKSELYWVMRRTLQEGVAMIPRKYQDVWRELQWHTYQHVVRSADTALAIKETKEKLRERYGRSPDSADAAVLGWSRTGMRPSFRLASM